MSRPHFWKDVPGFFTFPEFYAFLASEMPAAMPSRIVEVGVHSGQSLAFLGVELLRRMRLDCRIDGVDFFGNGPDVVREALRPIHEVLGALIQGESTQVAKRYPDASLDAVFIDADHGLESVRADIAAWLPKVRRGGIIAGHDFAERFPGVVQAVIEHFARFNVWRGSPFGDEQLFYPVWWVQR
jgi:predicted O-methyltransferase YrrM